MEDKRASRQILSRTTDDGKKFRSSAIAKENENTGKNNTICISRCFSQYCKIEKMSLKYGKKCDKSASKVRHVYR